MRKIAQWFILATVYKKKCTLPLHPPLLTSKKISDVHLKWYHKNNQQTWFNKAHGHDMISIHMLKICEIIFKSCLGQVIFPSERKKVNAVPIYKKNYKQGIENYQPVSLLPICSRIFELLIYDICFLICWKITSSENQSGF